MYFSFQNLSQGRFGSLIHFHHNLAPHAILTVEGSTKLSPPLAFGLQILFQATSAHLILSPLPFHRKDLWISLIFCSIPFGAGSIDRRYYGTACKTALVRTRRPAKFKALFVQCLHFFSILAITFSQCIFCHGLRVRGAPRYLNGSLPILNPRR